MTEPWVEVARLVDARMAELELVQADVARLAKVSPATVRSILNAERNNYRSGSIRRISRALGWVPTAIEDFAEGGEEPVEDESLLAISDRWAELSDLMDKRMEEMGLNRTEVGRVAAVSPITVRHLLAADQTGYRSATLRQISRALGWTPSAIEKFVKKGQMPMVAVEYEKPEVSHGDRQTTWRLLNLRTLALAPVVFDSETSAWKAAEAGDLPVREAK